MGKNTDDAFYRLYLGNQINRCIDLINNNGIQKNTPGAGLDQWKDFGCLLNVDVFTLGLPMMVLQNGVLKPWSNATYDPVDLNRQEITRLAEEYGTTGMLYKTNWGNVEEYITYRYRKDLSILNRSRFGLYKYTLPKNFQENIGDDADGSSILNSKGFVGTLVRFLPFQDSNFNTVLIRDAHSTLPNRSFKYDRDWYNTWINKTNKKIWMYNGIFYNPTHANGLKTTLAAAWGGRSRDGKAIMTLNEYTELFGLAEINEEKFYQKSSYGIDERIMYKFTNSSLLFEHTYLTGITHFNYLVYGQENPRRFKVYKNRNAGDNPTPEELKNIPDPENINGFMCREFEMTMPSSSYFTDLRCILLTSISKYSKNLNITDKEITLGQYYDGLENDLRKGGNDFAQTLLRMLPPRWNIWDYIFEHENLDNRIDLNREKVYDYINSKSWFDPNLNLNNICKINELFWTGNMFNFDIALYENIPLPDKIITPDDYPNKSI